MLTVEISLGKVDPLRVLVSEGPGATVLTSLVELFGPLRGRLPSALQARAYTLARQVDLRSLAPLRRRGPLPDGLFLSTSSRRTFAEELDRVSAHAELVAEQIQVEFPEQTPAIYRPWLRCPRTAMGDYVGALRSYHDVVVRELYPRLTERLAREADVYRRAVDGEGLTFLSRLHSKVKRHAGDLRYVELHKAGQLRLTPSHILLTPMVCAPQTVTTNLAGVFDSSTLHFAFASPSLAITDASVRTGGRRADPLAALTGTTRARLVREMVLAATTTDLAARLRLSPATISHHLHVLTASGTATSYRAGPCVYYRLTDRGHALLRLYGDPP